MLAGSWWLLLAPAGAAAGVLLATHGAWTWQAGIAVWSACAASLEAAFAFAVGRFISIDSGRRLTPASASQATAVLGTALAAAAAGAEIAATASGVRTVFPEAPPDLAYTACAFADAMGLAALLVARAARRAPRAWAAVALAAALAGSLYSAGKYVLLARPFGAPPATARAR